MAGYTGLDVVKNNSEKQNGTTRISKKEKNCKVGIITVARKTLLLIYTPWKNNNEFDLKYGLEIN